MRCLLIALCAACSASAGPPPAAPAPKPTEDLVSALAPLMPPDAMKDFDWTPDVARSPSEMVFANVQVLAQLSATRFMTAMMAMKASIGVECAHCHDLKKYPSDELGPKRTARRMMLLARHVNDSAFRGETRVTCWTCHRGEIKPASAPEGFADLLAKRPRPPALEIPAGAAEKPARKTWTNLQVLGGRLAPSLPGAMVAFTVTLGVECSHCHDENNWASDAKPAKERTRDMLRMVNRINAELGARGQATCWTCHRGVAVPLRTPG